MHPDGAWLGSVLIVNDNGWTTIMESSVSKRGSHKDTSSCKIMTLKTSEWLGSIMHNLSGNNSSQSFDPKHMSRLAKAYMEEQSVNWWKTPASIVDINPIERVWAELKRYIEE